MSCRPSKSSAEIVDTDIPARLDRLPWGRFHTLVVVALGITWILDGLEVTLAGAISPALKDSPQLRFSNADVGLAAGSSALCAPLYLIALYRWPVQVGSDEIAIMQTAKQSATLPHLDPFGASFYLTRPAMLFIVWGKLGDLIGGIDLFHMRLLHALVGLLAVAACYVLFRLVLLPRGWAVFAAVLVGASHSLFMISRLAMREGRRLDNNVSLLFRSISSARSVRYCHRICCS